MTEEKLLHWKIAFVVSDRETSAQLLTQICALLRTTAVSDVVISVSPDDPSYVPKDKAMELLL